MPALLLLDPPLLDNRLIFYYNNDRDQVLQQTVQNRPYQGGYRDFTPWPNKSLFPLSASTIEGPPRVSIAEDIAWYWMHNASSEQHSLALRNPYESTIFLRRILIFTLNSTVRHYFICISQHETKLWEMQRMIDPSLTDTEKDQYLGDFVSVMDEINKIRRKMNWFS